MTLRHASVFSQLLSLVSRQKFSQFVREAEAEKGAKGFSCWEQFVAMMFCQLAQAKSLREIHAGLRISGRAIKRWMRDEHGRNTGLLSCFY